MSYLKEQVTDDELVKTKNGLIAGKKVLFMGLSQSGKTSIIEVIFLGKDPKLTENTLATVNFQREKVNYEGILFQVIDVGGQLKYMEDVYSTYKESIFLNVKNFIYVIDVQNFGEFLSAREYFLKAIKYIRDYNEDTKINVLAHKIDLIPEDEREERVVQLTEILCLNDIEGISIFKTSIFEEELFRTMKQILT